MSVWLRLPVLIRAVLIGTAVALAGTTPWAFLVAINIKHLPQVPWAVVPSGLYLWLFWRYVRGEWWPRSTAVTRSALLRANPVSDDAWGLAILAGILGIAALVIFSTVLNRVIALPPQSDQGLSKLPGFSVMLWVLMGAVVAGVAEESSFRGYMQGPIERRHGPIVAFLVVGVLFGFAHFTHPEMGLRLLPFYVFAATVYGGLAWATNSILPGMVLHIVGDIFGALQLLATGQGEWQRPPAPKPLVWQGGADGSFWISLVLLIAVGSAAVWAYVSLRHAVQQSTEHRHITSLSP